MSNQTERPRFRPAAGDLPDNVGQATLLLISMIFVAYGAIGLAAFTLDWFLGSFIH